jgi:Fe2+ transport system protein FeoA
MTADQLNKGQSSKIIACSDLQMQDIGFIPGETLSIMEAALFGGTKVVRIGSSTFAVRDIELATVEIELSDQ